MLSGGKGISKKLCELVWCRMRIKNYMKSQAKYVNIQGKLQRIQSQTICINKSHHCYCLMALSSKCVHAINPCMISVLDLVSCNLSSIFNIQYCERVCVCGLIQKYMCKYVLTHVWSESFTKYIVESNLKSPNWNLYQSMF